LSRRAGRDVAARKNRPGATLPVPPAPSIPRARPSPLVFAYAVLILAAVWASYLPVLHAGWIWDDDAYVTKNLTLRTTHGLRDIWLHPTATPQYYPLVHTTFWLEYHFFGANPLPFHASNVALHAANALLLAAILARLSVPGAWIAGLLFALHPVEVESVAWITERKNCLSGFFYLLSFLTWLRYREPGATSPEARRRHGLLVLAFVLFVLALLSKTVTATLPCVALVVIWWKEGRVQRRDVLRLAPFVVVGMAFGLLTAALERGHVGAQGEEWALTGAQRALLAGRALWFYAGKVVLPTHLTFIYPRWALDVHSPALWLYAAAALAVVAAFWTFRVRFGRAPLAVALIFAGTLFPALGFFNIYPMRYSYVADHFQYLASAALLAGTASVIAALGSRRSVRGARFAALGSRASVRGHRFAGIGSRASVRRHRFAGIGSRASVRRHRSSQPPPSPARSGSRPTGSAECTGTPEPCGQKRSYVIPMPRSPTTTWPCS
jgi:hypothetical protein